MMFSDDSRGAPCAKDPSVIRFGNRYLLYYSIRGDDKLGWSIGIAESTDLDRWRKIGEILRTPDGPESKGVAAPGAIVLGGKVHIFYQTYGNWKSDAICHAVSADGQHFTRHPGNPIFRPCGGWNAHRAIDAEAFVDGDRLMLYYATRDPDMKIQQLGVAQAPLDSDFCVTAWTDLSLAGPVLKPQLAWERDCIEAPTLCLRSGIRYMFYAGAYNNAPQQIGVAWSADGLQFTRLLSEPLIPVGAPGRWNSSESGHPGVLVDTDGRTHLFFQGNADNGRTWFISRVTLDWKAAPPANGQPAALELPVASSFHTS